MVKLVSSKPSTKAKLEEGMISELPRTYMGMSGLGDSCNRKLWLQFRWCTVEEHTRRLGRLFSRGHREEKHIIADLSRIGIVCSSVQLTMVAGFGHIKGHNDGTAVNVPEAPKTRHLLEFKTLSDSSFKSVMKKGVKIDKPIYYAQVQLYMHHLKLTRCLWIAVNKNNDDYFVTRIKYDKEFAKELIRKGEDIILMEQMPPIRAPHSPTYFKCKHMCSGYNVCFRNAKFKKSCRSCKKGRPAVNGEWECFYHNSKIPIDFQRKGCDNYEAIENV